MKAYILKKNVLVQDWAPHPVHLSSTWTETIPQPEESWINQLGQLTNCYICQALNRDLSSALSRAESTNWTSWWDYYICLALNRDLSPALSRVESTTGPTDETATLVYNWTEENHSLKIGTRNRVNQSTKKNSAISSYNQSSINQYRFITHWPTVNQSHENTSFLALARGRSFYV